MSIGTIEFQKYCDDKNISKSHRVWAWGMWKTAQKLAKEKLAPTDCKHLTVTRVISHGEILRCKDCGKLIE